MSRRDPAFTGYTKGVQSYYTQDVTGRDRIDYDPASIVVFEPHSPAEREFFVKQYNAFAVAKGLAPLSVTEDGKGTT